MTHLKQTTNCPSVTQKVRQPSSLIPGGPGALGFFCMPPACRRSPVPLGLLVSVVGAEPLCHSGAPSNQHWDSSRDAAAECDNKRSRKHMMGCVRMNLNVTETEGGRERERRENVLLLPLHLSPWCMPTCNICPNYLSIALQKIPFINEETRWVLVCQLGAFLLLLLLLIAVLLQRC